MVALFSAYKENKGPCNDTMKILMIFISARRCALLFCVLSRTFEVIIFNFPIYFGFNINPTCLHVGVQKKKIFIS